MAVGCCACDLKKKQCQKRNRPFISFEHHFYDLPHSILFDSLGWLWLSWGSVSFLVSSRKRELIGRYRPWTEDFGGKNAPKITSWRLTVRQNGCRVTNIMQKGTSVWSEESWVILFFSKNENFPFVIKNTKSMDNNFSTDCFEWRVRTQ